jgi:hypothetical protein
MSSNSQPTIPPGVPAALNACIEYLASLSKHLPMSLPQNLPDLDSIYHFGFDPADVREEGLYYAFNHSLEVCFQTHLLSRDDLKSVIRILERGDRLVTLIKMIKRVAKEEPTQ